MEGAKEERLLVREGIEVRAKPRLHPEHSETGLEVDHRAIDLDQRRGRNRAPDKSDVVGLVLGNLGEHLAHPGGSKTTPCARQSPHPDLGRSARRAVLAIDSAPVKFGFDDIRGSAQS
jgi:hypothetical protein